MNDADRYFSKDYGAACRQFRESVAARGGRLESLALAAKGPKGEDLAIDVAWFGAPNPRRVLVHSSGLHGVEAFAGSAIQLQWLNEGLTTIPPDAAILVVHILNPFGMAWVRRFNENNVDLNRNFREPGEYTPDSLAHWDTLNRFLNPSTPPSRDGFHLRAAWLVLRHGMPSLRQAVAGGQCLNPKGLFFGGATLEEGPAKFQQFVKKHLAGAKRIVAIDVHTGLGRFAEDRLLVDVRLARSNALEVMEKVFGERIEFGKKGIAYSAKGAQQEMYFRTFPRAHVFFASQEFGTYRPLRVVAALRNENRAHHYGARSGVKQELLEVFNPRSETWRRAVLARGRKVIQQALRLAFE